MGKIYNLFHKVSNRYFNAIFILLCDIIIAVFSSAVALGATKLWFYMNASFRFAFLWVGISLFSSAAAFFVLRTNRIVIRHSTLRDVGKFAVASMLKMVLMVGVIALVAPQNLDNMPFYGLVLLDLMVTFVALIVTRVAMVYVFDHLRRTFKNDKNSQRVLVYGSDDKSISLITRLQQSPHFSIEGFLLYGGQKRKRISIANRPLYCFDTEANVRALRNKLALNAILFATEEDVRIEKERLVQWAISADMKILIAPSIDEVMDGGLDAKRIREVKIEDLLGREEIQISMEEIANNLRDKTVLVTGAAGSIGTELCRQLAGFGVAHMVLFDNAETPMHNLRLELEAKYPKLHFTPVIGDVRLTARLDFAFRTFSPDVVFHAAAYKHVPLMEENPCEAVLVNVAGSRKVADMCIKYNVEKMVMISTDKAVNPTNIMGCTKRLAEIYVQSLGLAIEQGRMEGKTKFVTTRFGNVLGSNGSVIPRFREQIAAGGPVTVTHPEITRFFMTIPEACRLVMEAATISTGNQIFVFDMGQSIKIDSLARRMIKLAGLEPDVDIKIEYSGLRPGEKLYEEVLANNENTLPTSHHRIRIAKVRDYDYAEAEAVMSELENLARDVDVPATVKLMKRTVPEYISNNSKYEQYDKHPQEAIGTQSEQLIA